MHTHILYIYIYKFKKNIKLCNNNTSVQKNVPNSINTCNWQIA